MGWSDKELRNLRKAYDDKLDNELIPTEPRELKEYLAKKKKRDPKYKDSHLRDKHRAVFDDMEREVEKAQPLLTLTEATIEMMDKDGDGWSEALEILYEKE